MAAPAGMAAGPRASRLARAIGLALGSLVILGAAVGLPVALAIGGVRLVLVTAEFRR
jgi:hypothetical protein